MKVFYELSKRNSHDNKVAFSEIFTLIQCQDVSICLVFEIDSKNVLRNANSSTSTFNCFLHSAGSEIMLSFHPTSTDISFEVGQNESTMSGAILQSRELKKTYFFSRFLIWDTYSSRLHIALKFKQKKCIQPDTSNSTALIHARFRPTLYKKSNSCPSHKSYIQKKIR